LDLRATVLDDPGSFFHRFASFGDAEMTAFAEQIWTGINLVNLRENVAPTRGRADLILEKGGDHRVHRITLRRS
jgi:type I pantothenate kinase